MANIFMHKVLKLLCLLILAIHCNSDSISKCASTESSTNNILRSQYLMGDSLTSGQQLDMMIVGKQSGDEYYFGQDGSATFTYNQFR